MAEQGQIEEKQGGDGKTFSNVRLWLRRVMPRVAVGAGLLFIAWIFLSNTPIYNETFLGTLLGSLTLIAACATIIYFGFKALRWLKLKLLWRVRRRLVITYLFVGLTPIILLLLLGLLSAFGGSGQGIARIITTQLNNTAQQTQSSAHGLAESFGRLPVNADDKSIQTWLDESVSLLRPSLPGARVALWRGGAGDDGATLGHKNSSQFVSNTFEDENTRAIGEESLPLNAPLPNWLQGRAEWSGLAFTLPTKQEDVFGSPSMRAMVRGRVNDRPYALLLVVPINKALVNRFRETTGINVRPFFIAPALKRVGGEVKINIDANRRATGRRDFAGGDVGLAEDVSKFDQFGEPLEESGINYPVVLTATNWVTGENEQHESFVFNWTTALAKKQFFGAGEAGAVWREALWVVAIAFLVLELLALFAAAWMTRAVTGTVHKLYRGVEYIKRGDFSHRVRTRSHDQLGELATAFNNMSANIEVLLEERVERERLEREVEIAAEVQAQLFPRNVPELLTTEISAECRAARGVAGDYYDYIEVAPGLVVLALGDVSGKGVSASLVMSNLQASLRAQTTITAERLSIAERMAAAAAGESKMSGKLLAQVSVDAEINGAVARKIANINRQLCQSTESNRFATLFLALYEDGSRTLRYTNAGHNAPLLIRADKTVERLSVGGMAVGAFDWASYEEAAAKLQPDDLLLIFSDGISEAENEAGEEYGEERLQHFAVEHHGLSAEELRNAIFQEIDSWSGGRERGDDQTLVIVKSR
ncbi:MAG TPA: SpoIIE family protein phosphatase [Pyrinomonadaceae bacterium]